MADEGFDFSPGAQVPLAGAAGKSAVTQALASVAYRDSPVAEILKADNEWYESKVKPPKLSLLEPNLGEAFARAVQTRMLGGARKALIQSFGVESQAVVEHCLAANRIRKERDIRLTVVMVLFGLVFLPGVLLWLGAFQLRRTLAGAQNRRAGFQGTALLVALGALVVLLLVKLPLIGFWAAYLRAMVVAPVIGWLWAKQICEHTAKDLRERWEALLGSGGVGAKVPEAVPQNPSEKSAEQLRQSLVKLTAEQHSNLVFYAGTKGILGMGTRWGKWPLVEDLKPADPSKGIHPFRSWDVIRAMHDQLRMLERGLLHTGGFPTPVVKHWVVTPVGEGATEVSRPNGTEVSAFQIKGFELERICNEEQFGSSNRHYLGVQFIPGDGRLVITFLVTVRVLHHTLRIEVSGYALGPVHSLFTTKPAAKTKEVVKSVRFWETKKVNLPLVDAKEVVRLAARAPLTWLPPVLDFLGGGLTLPEPFGLRHVWAGQPWRDRFMTDDILHALDPVVRVMHEAAIRVLEENGVDTEHFRARANTLRGTIQGAEPLKADIYNA